MSQISAAATSAREAARSTDGRFGSYTSPEADGVDVGAPAEYMGDEHGTRYRRTDDGWTPDSAPDSLDTRSIVTANGSRFMVRLVREGGAYGATGALTADSDMVEFRDGDSDQMVSRYYTEDFDAARGRGGGLSLYGGETKWSLDEGTVEDVGQWVQYRLTGQVAPSRGHEGDDRTDGVSYARDVVAALDAGRDVDPATMQSALRQVVAERQPLPRYDEAEHQRMVDEAVDHVSQGFGGSQLSDWADDNGFGDGEPVYGDGDFDHAVDTMASGVAAANDHAVTVDLTRDGDGVVHGYEVLGHFDAATLTEYHTMREATDDPDATGAAGLRAVASALQRDARSMRERGRSLGLSPR